MDNFYPPYCAEVKKGIFTALHTIIEKKVLQYEMIFALLAYYCLNYVSYLCWKVVLDLTFLVQVAGASV